MNNIRRVAVPTAAWSVAIAAAFSVLGGFAPTAASASTYTPFPNSAVVSTALSYLGTYQGQCYVFVYNVLRQVSHGQVDIGGADIRGYRTPYVAAGAQPVPLSQAQPGDVVQLNSTTTDAYVDGMHTAIVYNPVSSSNWNVIDSNWGLTGIVKIHHGSDVVNWANSHHLQINVWRFGTVFSQPSTSTAILARYYNGSDHAVSTAAAPASYRLEGTLGSVSVTAQPGTHALYGCLVAGVDQMLSNDAHCEGQTVLRLEGYLWNTQPSQGVPVYRCRAGTEHFASNDAGCEGRTVEGLLGYAKSTVGLLRYFNGSYHWVTTGTVPVGFGLEGGLGLLRATSASNAHPLFGCMAGSSQFLSADPGCEHQTLLGVEGWAYNSQAGPNSVALYRCRVGTDHFVSTDPGCEGQITEGALGWTVSPGLRVS